MLFFHKLLLTADVVAYRVLGLNKSLYVIPMDIFTTFFELGVVRTNEETVIDGFEAGSGVNGIVPFAGGAHDKFESIDCFILPPLSSIVLHGTPQTFI
jgi:hypothetical protein